MGASALALSLTVCLASWAPLLACRVVFRGVTLLDTPPPAFLPRVRTKVDVRVADGVITEIGEGLKAASGEVEVAAYAGKHLTPAFIDR